MEKLNLLIQDVIKKKELKALDPGLAKEKIEKYLSENPKAVEKLENLPYPQFRRGKEFDLLQKQVRQELRKIYGVFIMPDHEKKYTLLEQLKKNREIDLEIINKILLLHKSSYERLDYYKFVYEQIFSITGKPKKILDLACGLNPVSYPYLDCNPEYVAGDIGSDINFIQEFFKAAKVLGEAKTINLLTENLANLGAFDVCFLFKTLDSVEAVERHSSKRILESIQAKFIVVSFATKSIGGRKNIKKEKRIWFEKLAKRMNFETKEFEIPGEIFYVLGREKF